MYAVEPNSSTIQIDIWWQPHSLACLPLPCLGQPLQPWLGHDELECSTCSFQCSLVTEIVLQVFRNYKHCIQGHWAREVQYWPRISSRANQKKVCRVSCTSTVQPTTIYIHFITRVGCLQYYNYIKTARRPTLSTSCLSATLNNIFSFKTAWLCFIHPSFKWRGLKKKSARPKL